MLAGLTGVVSYLDDIIIVGKTASDHCENVNRVFHQIREWGFHSKREECKFFLPSVKYLGFIIDRHRRRPDPEKISAIIQMPSPTDITTLRSFIGMLNYYGQFIKQMRELRAPLDKMLIKDVKWNWTKECQLAFEKAKSTLQSDLLLTHFDPQHIIKVAADASSYGIGAVILHRFPDNTEKAIAHAARALTTAEHNFRQIEKEGLARNFIECFMAVILFCRSMERKVFLCTQPTANRRSLGTNTYDFKIEHISTSKFGHADVLSRLMQRDSVNNEEYVIASVSALEAEIHQVVAVAVRALPLTSEMISKATAGDVILQQVRTYMHTSWPEKLTEDIRTYYNRREALAEIGGCIILSDRIIIPLKFQKTVLRKLHKGHPGIVRMKALARSYVYWPKIDNRIEQLVQQCSRCASVAKAPSKTTLSSWPAASKPWSRIHIDYAGPFLEKKFLVVVDAFSKWPEIIIQPQTTSLHTIAKLRELFACFGVPDVLVSDNGTQFTSKSFNDFCAINGVKLIHSPPFTRNSTVKQRGSLTLLSELCLNRRARN